MKFVILLPDLGNGGRQKAMFYLYKGLIEKGEVAYLVVTYKFEGYSFLWEEAERCSITKNIKFLRNRRSFFDKRIPGRGASLIEIMEFVFKWNVDRKLKRCIRDILPDFIYGPGYVFKKTLGIRYMYHLDDSLSIFLKRGLAKFFSRMVLRAEQLELKNADRVILSSAWYKSYVSHFTQKYSIVYHGCNPAKQIHQEKDLITIPKRITSNVETLLPLLTLLPSHRFCFIGSFSPTSYRDQFVHKLKSLGATNYEIHENLSESKLYELLDRSLIHLGMYPENLGIYALEGASRGSIPILPMRTGALEALLAGREAVSYESGDVNDLKSKILWLLSDSSMMFKLSEAAYKKSQQYSWSNFASQILELSMQMSIASTE